ncbi:MAG TPA: hypothetical protein PLQ76_07495 [bacterium]|nr:hypothetical protein [bacterium]
MTDRENAALSLFKKKKMVLIASLPGNGVDLAKAAEAGGADMLKVHINVVHAASGTRFGPFEEERPKIEAILSAVKIPVSIMPGAAEKATLEEMRTLEKMGVSFYDIYASDMPAEYLTLGKMAAMAALGDGWRDFEPAAASKLGVKMLEASIVPHAGYGSPLALSDLLAYSYIASEFKGAVIVPTQKAIAPEQVAALHKAKVKGLMYGKIVAGDTPEGFEKAAARLGAAIAEL